MMSVSSVCTSPSYSFGKALAENIYLLRGCGVEGDIHCTASPNPSNLRQVHLIASELLRDLAKPDRKGRSYGIQPGALGENILTQGIDLIRLSEGTRLHFGDHEGHAVVRITGLRNPKKRLNEWPAGLLDRCAIKNKKGDVVGRKVGVMGVVEEDGYVMSGYAISIEEPSVSKGLNNV
jgi:MOSC domain-containing protein YiiM